METIRLFDKDSKLSQFEACVLSCEEDGDLYKVTLTETAFFPEEGGQTCDKGTLQDLEVVKVHEKDRVVYHWVKEPLWEGDTVTGYIDFQKRFSDMQQHTGEHIVSGIVNSEFGYDNVGFHLGSEFVTMDYNGPLTWEQLRFVEKRANQAVAANIKVIAEYPSKEELAEIDYRSKKELEGDIRIVTIPGYDTCACCAPHVYSTGEIGIIKLVNMEKYKGGTRVYMLCGFRALADYNEKEDSVRKISAILSAKPADVAAAVEKQKEEIAALKFQLNTLKTKVLEDKIAALDPSLANVCMFDESLDKTNIKRVYTLLTEKYEGVCACFSGNDQNGYSFILGSRIRDAKEEGNKMTKALNGRGGGSKDMFQGNVKASEAQIRSYFAEIV